MCMPVFPKSRSPAHRAEAAVWTSIHSVRIAAHLIQVADEKHLCGKGVIGKEKGPAEMEAYVKDLVKAVLEVVKALHEVRENVRYWRDKDDEEGSGQYVI